MTALTKAECSPFAATDIEGQIGHTALLGFRRVTRHLPRNIRIFAKAEWQNPGGSVKDRAAAQIVRAAESDGRLAPGKTIMDSTSGNTGIAYAMIAAAKGYGVKLFLPSNVSPERVAILRAYGVDLAFTDPLEGADGALKAARELAAKEPQNYFYADQYSNPANWQAHYDGTGLEIWQQTGGRVTHFVAGLGTSGTLMGSGRRLKQCNPEVKIVSVEPDSPFHGLEGLKHMNSAIQPGLYDPDFADVKLGVRTEAAYAMARRLAREEGYLVGISAAAAMVGCLEIAEELARLDQAAVIATIFPDNAYKYLREAFWGG